MVARDITIPLWDNMSFTLCLMVVLLRSLSLLSPAFFHGSRGCLIRQTDITKGPKNPLNFYLRLQKTGGIQEHSNPSSTIYTKPLYSDSKLFLNLFKTFLNLLIYLSNLFKYLLRNLQKNPGICHKVLVQNILDKH
jgi:hypothetical protein